LSQYGKEKEKRIEKKGKEGNEERKRE